MPRRRQRKATSHQQTHCDINEETKHLPYRIKKSETMGRYLVASSDLPAGTVILSEEALIVGPVQDFSPVCLGCYTSIEQLTTTYRCEKCHWPLCSKTCKGIAKRLGHSKEECSFLENCEVNSSKLPVSQLYNVIVPLRCLLLKEHHPDKWRILMSMEAHNNIRQKIPSIWNKNQISVVDRIRSDWKILKFPEEEIHTICGILEVNAFAVGDSSLNIRGLYPTAFLIAHSCVPNTSHSDDDEYRVTILSSVQIPKEEMIALSYTNTLEGTEKRKHHLKESKFFECNCARCQDPTELGTYLSGIKCRKCGFGSVLSINTLNPEADWKCNNKKCLEVLPAQDVHSLINRIGGEIKKLDYNNILILEKNIQLYSKVLHQNHYYMLGIKYALSQLYGKAPGYLISQMNEAMLERKQQICEDILHIFDILEPGLSHVRGLTMYELHAPMMVLALQRFKGHQISKTELRKKIQKVVFYLRECCQILKYEPKTTQEGSLRTAAEDALKQLKSWEPVIGKI